MESANKSSGNGAKVALGVALLGSLAGNVYQYQHTKTEIQYVQSKTDSLQLATNDIETELKATYEDLDRYKGQNAQMDSLLAEANTRVDEQKIRITQLIKQSGNSAELNKKLQAELASLRSMRDEYLDKIDSLMLVNQQLTSAKQELTGQVEKLTSDLESTVDKASILKVEYLKPMAFKRRSSNKYSETSLAKRTNKIEVTFSVLDNSVAKPGEKNVFMAITEPSGKVLGNRSEGSNSFKLKGSGEEVLYTAGTKIDYKNTKEDIKLLWEEQERNFAPGEYKISVYVDYILVGLSSITLK